MIALVSTPWPLFNRPSVQLGVLKAYVERHLRRPVVHAYHPYLALAYRIGYKQYTDISERIWLAESPFAALLYPGRFEEIKRFWTRHSKGIPSLESILFEDICRTVREHTIEEIDGTDWKSYKLVGFSICFGQVTSSLYYINRIKSRVEGLRVVTGGSACAGEMGDSLLSMFPEIDFIIQGEGEKPLAELADFLLGEDGGTVSIEGVKSRRSTVSETGHSQITDLDSLPVPDYNDYFDKLKALGSGAAFFPRIPMEISRGCWWKKKVSHEKGSGCSFCNLNLQWNGYRSKTPQRVVSEVENLVRKYELLSVSFMDNLLPVKDLDAMFERISELGKDLRLFSEIRATTSLDSLCSMAKAGMQEVQVGIEALSSSLLKKLNKGTTAMDNIEIMKHCEMMGSPDLTGNLILCFPLSDEGDVSETLENLSFVFPFRPLKAIPFWLGYGSTVWERPADYGIRRTGNHRFYGYLFPSEILKGLTMMIQGYTGVMRRQRLLWEPAKKKMLQWKHEYSRLHQGAETAPILSYRDGGGFMIISQRRFESDDMTHRLRGTSRKIYLFCYTRRSLREIVGRFPKFGEEKLVPFLRMMVDKGLMFREGDRYLSLAVPVNGLRNYAF